MTPKLNRPMVIGLIVVVVLALAGLITWLFMLNVWVGAIVLGVILLVLGALAAVYLPPILRWAKFQKGFKKHEAAFQQLPNMMVAGRTPQALMLFEEAMKEAPENAYTYYLRAQFTERAGKLPEALSAVNKALELAGRDPMLPMLLQQTAEQGLPGQPSTVEEFKAQLQLLKASLEPKVFAIRQSREKAKKERKKKSR